jgi:hypothetical protein
VSVTPFDRAKKFVAAAFTVIPDTDRPVKLYAPALLVVVERSAFAPSTIRTVAPLIAAPAVDVTEPLRLNVVAGGTTTGGVDEGAVLLSPHDTPNNPATRR